MRRVSSAFLAALALTVLTACLAGYGFFRQQRAEENALRFIADIPGTLAAAKAEAAFFSDEITLYGLEGDIRYIPDAPLRVSFARLTLRGLPQQDVLTDKNAKIAEYVQAEGVRLRADGGGLTPVAGFVLALDSVTARDLRLDAKSLRQAEKNGLHSKEFVRALLSVNWAESSGRGLYVRAEENARADAAGNAPPDIVALERFTAESVSPDKARGVSLHGLTVLADAPVYTESVSIATFSCFPALPRILLEQALVPGQSNEAAFTPLIMLLSDGLSIKGSLTGLRHTPHGTDHAFGITGAQFDCSLGSGKLAVNVASDGVAVPYQMVTENSTRPERLAELLQHRDLRFSGLYELRLALEGLSSVNVRLKHDIAEQNLGACRGESEIAVGGFMGESRGRPTLTIKSGFLELKDTGWLALAYALRVMEENDRGRAVTVAQYKAEHAADVRNNDRLPPDLRAALAAFLEQSGTLSLTFVSPTPVTLGVHSLLLYPNATMPVRAEHTPPQEAR